MSNRLFFGTLLSFLLLHLVGTWLWGGFPRAVDFFLVLTVVNATDGRPLGGLLGGLVCGLVHDTLSGGLYGMFGFADAFVGYATARVSQRLVTRRMSGLSLVFLCAAVLQQALLILLEAMLLPQAPVEHPGWLAGSTVVDALLALGLFSLREGWRRRNEHRQHRRQSQLRF